MTVNTRLINNSVVVLGEEYNPAILNPDSLKSMKIAKKDWELAEKAVSTPLLSIVQYMNGLRFLTQPNKLEVQDNNPLEDLSTSEVPVIAEKYLRRFSYLRHTAVGVNVTLFIELPEARKYLIDEVIQSGPWKNDDLQSVAIKLVYSLQEVTLNLSMESGGIRGSEEKGMVVNANYHTNIDKSVSIDASLRRAKKAIEHAGEYFLHSTQFVPTLFTESK